MRVDKFLKLSRIIKRRTIAKEACAQGRVLVNDKAAKPGTEIKVSDVIELNFGTNTMKVEVLELLEHVSKDKAQELYRVIE